MTDWRKSRGPWGTAVDVSWRRWGIGVRVMVFTGVSFEVLAGPVRFSLWYYRFWAEDLPPMPDDYAEALL